MYHRTMRLRVVLALALGFVLAACNGDDTIVGPETSPQASPQIPAPQPVVATDPYGNTYTIIEGPPLGFPLQLTKLISVQGGTISLLGHTLVVPKGAVTSPTLFTMLVGLNGKVEVHLTALVPTLFNLLNIGEQGFRKPVRLTLSYAHARNVQDPNDLVIVYVPGLLGYNRVEPLPTTVDTVRKTVTAELDHFSRYALATN
ncbi:MAG TPA: hypothetical protein VIL18_03630 [Longimicrobiales bacterium]